MLIENYSEKRNTEKVKDYFDSFVNFLNKAPIIFSKIERVGDTFYIYIAGDEENPVIFQVFLEQDKHKQIKMLKNMLINFYPVIYSPVSKEPSLSEKIRLEEEGKTLEEILEYQIETFEPKYRVLRVHSYINEIDIEDVLSHDKFRCKVYIPVVSLLQSLYRDTTNLTFAELKLYKENTHKLFSQKVKIKFQIKPGFNSNDDKKDAE